MAVAAWSSPEWLAEVTQWVQQCAESHNLPINGALEHVRTGLTAVVYRVHTAQSNLYFKATTPPYYFEAALTEKLAQWFPAELPRIYGADPARGWLLMQDVGKTLRPQTTASGDFMPYPPMLRHYAKFQQGTVQHVPELLKLGVPDRRPDKLPGLYAALLEDDKTLLVGKPGGFTPDEIKRLRDFTLQVTQMCEQPATFAIPAALHHDDFHDNNIAFDGKNYLFFDWGECAITQPFFSMMVLLRVVKYLHKRPDMVEHLTDSYLAAWTEADAIERLREAFPISQRLAVLCRALTWHTVLSTHTLTEAEMADSGDSAAYYLRLFWEYETSEER